MGSVAVFHGENQPLTVEQFPTPAPLGTEILVDIECCTLCKSDLQSWQGKRSSPTPGVLGHEIVGRIAAFGPEANRRDALGKQCSTGDRITWCVSACCGACFYCQHQLTQKCVSLKKYGHEQFSNADPFRGGFADTILLWPGTGWLRVPETIPVELAAMANCSIATATAALRLSGKLPGSSLVILGAGILGLMAAAQAREAGASVVMVSDPIEAYRQRALSFGATHAIGIQMDEMRSAVLEVTEGRGADIVLELAGTTQTVAAGLDLLRIGGTMILAGTVSPVQPVSLHPESFVRRMLSMRGLHNYQIGDLVEAVRFLEQQVDRYPWETLIGERFPLHAIDEALAFGRDHPGQRVAVFPSLEGH